MQMTDREWIIEEDETPIDFSKLIHKIKANWLYSVLGAILFTCIALLYILSTNATYNVDATLLIKDNNNTPGGSSSGTGMMSSLQDLGLLQGASNVNNEQNIITSYPLIHKVVTDLQLYVQYNTHIKLKNVPLYKQALPFTSDIVGYNIDSIRSDKDKLLYQITLNKQGGYTIESDGNQWKGLWNIPLRLPFGHLTLQQDSLTTFWDLDQQITMNIKDIQSVTDYYHNTIDAEIPDKQTTIINLTLPTIEPNKGVDILNALIADYQIANVDDNNGFIDSTLKFINARLLSVGTELDSIEDHIQNFKEKNNLADITAQSQALIANAGNAEQAINGTQVQISMVNSLIDYMKTNEGDDRAIPASLTITDASVSGGNQPIQPAIISETKIIIKFYQ